MLRGGCCAVLYAAVDAMMMVQHSVIQHSSSWCQVRERGPAQLRIKSSSNTTCKQEGILMKCHTLSLLRCFMLVYYTHWPRTSLARLTAQTATQLYHH